ncbi:MAG: hypothetical protein K2F90_04400 [Clostridiales bacterium]|nr:hypothetical protein [Clostridiales bacterium]
MKGDLFCIRTNKGYGLFQECGTYIEVYGPFYCVYYTQIPSLSLIDEALRGKYYYQRIEIDEFGGRWTNNFFKRTLMENKGNEISLYDVGIASEYHISEYYYKNCYMTYLGNYSLPSDAEIPRYTRQIYEQPLAGKYSWHVVDEAESKAICNEKGKIIFYKKLNEETKNYPNRSTMFPSGLLLRFNQEYRNEDGDLWAERQIEEFFEKNPQYRPSNEKYDDIKYPLPTDELRATSEQYDSQYAEFCDRVEKALLKFIAAIDENRKAVKAPLLSLLKELNAIDKDMQLFGSIESEEIYTYLVRILRALKKSALNRYA